MSIRYLFILSLAVLQLSACSTPGTSSKVEQPATVETRDTDANAVTGGVGQVQPAPALPISMPGLGAPTQKILYFDFDRSDIRADQRAVAEAHVRYLLAHPDLHIRLEGHADERGSREYNLALGERRAQAVHRYFSISGILSDRMNTLSYGEEYPLDPRQSEAAWNKNRRVEIVYLGGGL